MVSRKTVSAIRFGYGLGPGNGPENGDDILARLQRGDVIAPRYPVLSTARVMKMAARFRKVRRQAEKNDRDDRDALQKAREELGETAMLALSHGVARILDSGDAFRERLVWFWADHFTAVPKSLPLRAAAPAYIDEAIRPHVTGRFADMLRAVVSHPFMLIYLDQVASVGPNSPLGRRQGRGLNENLARELLELHTLGVAGEYGQGDVRALAGLLTGLTFSQNKGFVFNPRMAEPGPHRVLGRTYGANPPSLAEIHGALEDLARHPDTARHLVTKLLVHFVSDTPEPAMVARLSAVYLQSDGDLGAVYAALLADDLAWGPPNKKAKQPFDFIVSALVALGVSGQELLALERRRQRRLLLAPLSAMGQPFMQARGPDGWPEEAEAWITPQGLATRIAWSLGLSERVADRVADPGEFLQSTLADMAGDKLNWAVSEVTSSADGVALVFASAAFNRR